MPFFERNAKILDIIKQNTSQLFLKSCSCFVSDRSLNMFGWKELFRDKELQHNNDSGIVPTGALARANCTIRGRARLLLPYYLYLFEAALKDSPREAQEFCCLCLITLFLA